jgi:RimJ/RimL family protein N-acetyltransferase
MTNDHLRFIIIALDEASKPEILAHLFRLSKDDRYLRFFAALSDTAIERYIAEMDLAAGAAFGVRTLQNPGLIGFAHVSKMACQQGRNCAEVGFSIDKEFRGHGLANRLMDRVVTHCQASGIDTLFMSCLRTNAKMQAVAKNFGLQLMIDADEAIAELEVTEQDRIRARGREIAYQQIQLFDKVFRHNADLTDLVLNTPH